MASTNNIKRCLRSASHGLMVVENTGRVTKNVPVYISHQVSAWRLTADYSLLGSSAAAVVCITCSHRPQHATLPRKAHQFHRRPCIARRSRLMAASQT